MRYFILTITAMLAVGTAQADIFKCQVNGKSTYQSSPCQEEKNETALKIKTTEPDNDYRPPSNQSDIVRRDREQKLFDAKMAAQQAETNRKQAAADAAYQRSVDAERRSDIAQQEADIRAEEGRALSDYLKSRTPGAIINRRP